MFRFETIKHVRSLREVLLPDGWDPEEELDAVLRAGFSLSQRDRWENNGVLLDLFVWSKNEHNQLLWIGGMSGRRDTWVTELSADIVQALQPQLVTLLYVFCDQPKRTLTVMGLVRHLLVHLLDLQPQLAYRWPELCNGGRFKEAVTFGQLWQIFMQLTASVPNLFIVIDRIEACFADEQADLVCQLLPSLIRLAGSLKEMSVLVTSTMDPPEEVSELSFYKTYIDTSRKSKWR